MSYDGDQQISHQNWVQSIGEARQSCRKSKVAASVNVSNPEQALWPPVAKHEMTAEHQAVAQFHAAVLDYCEHVEPFRHRLKIPRGDAETGLWEERLGVHEFPDGDELAVRLGTLEEWADRRYETEETVVDELEGRTTKTAYKRVHLPTQFARLAFRQLNECLDQLQLAADLKKPDHAAVGPDNAI